MKIRTGALALCAVLLAGAAALIWLCGQHRVLPCAEEMREAARLFENVENTVKTERLARGIPLSPEDRFQTGLIGWDSSAITTTIGAAEAKRTSCLPDMAALCVRLLHEAGVQPGETVGAVMSGSFPGLNLAFLCAAKVMDVRVVYTAAVGASSYGANIPDYVFPEMVCTAVEAGLLPQLPAQVSLGGDGDEGRNMIGVMLEDTEAYAALESIAARLEAAGLPLHHYRDFSDNIETHLALYGEIRAFVNIGGNVAGIGRGESVLNLGQGLLKPRKLTRTSQSGLLEYYLSEGVSTIQLLNLKALCFDYGLVYDPPEMPAPGQSGVYFENHYSRPAILGVLAAAAAVPPALMWLRRKKKAE